MLLTFIFYFISFVFSVSLSCCLIYIFYFALRRFWVFKVDRKGVYGSDYHFLEWSIKEQRRSYFLSECTFSESVSWPEIEQTICHQVQSQLSNPDSSFYFGCSWERRNFYIKSQLGLDDIVDFVHSDSAFYSIGDHQNREVIFRLYPEKKLVGVLFDHVCFDGLRFFNEVVQPIFESKPFSSKWMSDHGYRPVISECLQLYSLARVIKRSIRQKHLPLLPDHQQFTVQHELATKTLKMVKKETRSSFTGALLGIYAQRLFESLDASFDSLCFGIILGFDETRFRNNYSIIMLRLYRSETIAEYVEQIEVGMSKHKVETVPLYHLLCLSNLQSYFKNQLIDCLFSPAFFYPKSGLSTMVKEVKFFNIPCSCAVYSFTCMIGDTVYISSTINTPLLSDSALAKKSVAVFRQSDFYQLYRSDSDTYTHDITTDLI